MQLRVTISIGDIYEKYLEEEIMNNIEIKQITKIDDDTLATITKWMHNWWGRED